MSGTAVIVPVKRLDGAKSRLAEVLDAEHRRMVMLALLEDVLERAFAAEGVATVHVATSDEAAAQVGLVCGANVLSDGGREWNAGLAHALRQIVPRPESVLFLAADLPAVGAQDITALIAATPARGIAIGQARDGGTNALAVRPPLALAPCFGVPESAAAHARRAADNDLEVVVVDRPGLALDLDTPADLEDALALGLGGRDRAWRAMILRLAEESWSRSDAS